MAETPTDEGAPRAVLRTFSSRAEADLVSNVLAGAGIESFVIADDCGAVDPALTFVRGVKVLVAQEDFDRAESLLDGEPSADETARSAPT